MSKQPDYPAILTKENFWNELMTKYPAEMERFCKWVDEYKKRVNWTSLFHERLHFPEGYDELAPKFHEIPVAMQIGIFLQFMSEDDRLGLARPMAFFIADIEKYFHAHSLMRPNEAGVGPGASARLEEGDLDY